MKKDKKYVCCFEEGMFINEHSEEYKNKCCFSKQAEVVYRKFYDKHLFRYSMTCKLAGNGKPITVILMNPSYADEYGLDATLTKVKEFLEKQDKYSEFEVLNIFPIRTPNSNNLISKMERYQKYQKQNNEYIKKILAKSENILIAWGSKYHKHATWIFEYLKEKNVYAYGINKDQSPRHFAPQAYNRCKNVKNKKYELCLYKI